MRQIREIVPADISACAELLIDAYNREPWQDHWTMDTAVRYLSEFAAAVRFKGFLVEDGGIVLGAAFCHGRTWWSADELYVDEFYIASGLQRQGLGGELLAQVEKYVRAQGWKEITLLTNRSFPARDFYGKHGFEPAEQVIFLYKKLE